MFKHESKWSVVFQKARNLQSSFLFPPGPVLFCNNMPQPSPSNKIKHFTQTQLNVVERSSSSESSSQAAIGLDSQVGKEKPGNDISTVRPITDLNRAELNGENMSV